MRMPPPCLFRSRRKIFIVWNCNFLISNIMPQPRLCGEVIRLLLKYCIYCASAPSLHRESTDSPILGIRMRIRCLTRSTWEDRNGEARSADETTPCYPPPIRSRVSERSKSLGCWRASRFVSLFRPVARFFWRGVTWMSNVYIRKQQARKTRGVWGDAPPGNF